MEKLLEIINEVLSNSELKGIENLDATLKLQEDLKMDSLMLAELTVRIEMEYGIDIFEDSIVTTIEEVIKKLEI